MNVFVLVIILLVTWWLFSRKSKIKPTAIVNSLVDAAEPLPENLDSEYNIAQNIYPYYDHEKSNWYREVTVPFSWYRKSYVLGQMVGKYYGERLPEANDKTFYQIKVYEAEIRPLPRQTCSCTTAIKEYCHGIHIYQEGDFQYFENPVFFHRSQLPDKFILHIPEKNLTCKLEVSGLSIYNVHYIQNLHQKENNEVFGTIKCTIKGYFTDTVTENRTHKDYKPVNQQMAPPSFPNGFPREIPSATGQTKSPISEHNQNFAKSYTASGSLSSKSAIGRDFEWKVSTSNAQHDTDRYAESGSSWLFVLLALLFFAVVFPALHFLLAIIVLVLLFSVIPYKTWKWLINILGFLHLGLFVLLIGWSIFGVLRENVTPIVEIPKYVVASSEIKAEPKAISEQANINNKLDTILRFSKEWSDYTGKEYNGYYHILKSDYQKSKHNKHALFMNENRGNYNYVVHKLKEFDQPKLEGLFQMLDSLATTGKMNQTDFASMVIAFVQDYNYSLILPQECDPRLYADNFVKEYLQNASGQCVPNEPFGIMTPLETIATSRADCDSRTLLIYTILSKYGYDVVMLSSDLYSHSIIGINLPYQGSNFYVFGNTKYALVETTVRAARPGYISNEIANMNNWYVSLKSK